MEFKERLNYMMNRRGIANAAELSRMTGLTQVAIRNYIRGIKVPNALVKKWNHLPVVVDPSHGTGIRDLVIPMFRAAIAIGADGLIIEVHDHPEEAFSDGPQSLKPDKFAECIMEIRKIAEVMGRKV